jgi:hypothetical protein
MSQRTAKPKVPRGVEARWHVGRAIWTFRVRWTDPVSGERRSQEFDTADDAVDYHAYLRLARRRGALDELRRGRVVLSEFVEDDWWPHHAGRRLSRHTLTAYAQVWNRNLLPRVGHLELRPADDADGADAARGARGRRARAGDRSQGRSPSCNRSAPTRSARAS